IDRADARPGVRAPQAGRVEQAGRHHVGDKAAAPPEQTRILVAPDRRSDEPGGHPALPVSWSPLAFVAFGLIALSAECEASTVAILPRCQRGCQGTARICSQGNPDSERSSTTNLTAAPERCIRHLVENRVFHRAVTTAAVLQLLEITFAASGT